MEPFKECFFGKLTDKTTQKSLDSQRINFLLKWELFSTLGSLSPSRIHSISASQFRWWWVSATSENFTWKWSEGAELSGIVEPGNSAEKELWDSKYQRSKQIMSSRSCRWHVQFLYSIYYGRCVFRGTGSQFVNTEYQQQAKTCPCQCRQHENASFQS